MRLLENEQYQNDVRRIAETAIPWEKLKNTSILISGATGMIGKFLIDVIMFRNMRYQQQCKIYALGRNTEKAIERFEEYEEDSKFAFIPSDINKEIEVDCIEKIDYVIHAASNTHPIAYAKDPIGTITTNVLGLKNMLDIAKDKHIKRFLFLSSVEIYGENKGNVELFDEEYCGYIDCNTLRAGYPESKRVGEALCQAYRKQYEMDIVIPRMARSFGPTMLLSDSKASSQFIKKGVAGENIILKSKGNQLYSYIYVADAVSGILTCMLLGEDGQAYNIADEKCNVRLLDMARITADCVGTNVLFEMPNQTEQEGYSKATKALMNSKKIRNLGWEAKYDLSTGLKQTIDILKNTQRIEQ